MRNFKLNTPNIKKTVITPQMVRNRNCENFIGATQVPLGIAGPLELQRILLCKNKGVSFVKRYYLPLATTEGALVASINRGCKATRLSGGIKVFVENVGATRAVLFRVKNLAEGRKLVEFIEKNFGYLKKIVQKTDSFISLFEVQPQLLGKNVWLRFYFDTCEAMGMNMVTLASQKIADFVKEKLKIDCLSLSGNLCVDKKPSWLNFIQGRGKKVWAESVIKKAVVGKVLKTTPERIVALVFHKAILGSSLAGSLGFNGHYANIVAALFLATGQDIAHVVEGSLGATWAEVEENGDLYFSIYMPDVMVGTVGGGTFLPTQKEALKILGLDKARSGDSWRLAEVVGAAVLAGELSLTATLAAGHLAKAHERLGRGKK